MGENFKRVIYDFREFKLFYNKKLKQSEINYLNSGI